MIRRLQYLVLGIPALLFFREIIQHLQNIPVMDDYDIILDFLNQYIVSEPLEKLGMIVAQYNEHRLIPSKLLYIAYNYLTGGVNFRVLGIIGDLQLIPVALIGVYFIKKAHNRWFWPALIWMFVVFDLSTYENSCMTMYAVANYGVICYFFCALYFYERRQYVWAVLFQSLCIGSNANGLMAAVLLFIACLVNRAPRNRWLICGIVNAVLIPCYFIEYESVVLPNALPFSVTRDLIYLVRMIGAPVSFNLSLYFGALVIVLLALLLPYKSALKPVDLSLTIILAFLAGTIVLTAVFRAGYSDAQFQTSRYLIYPQMLLGILGLYCWRRLDAIAKIRWTRLLVPLVVVLIYVGNYAFGDAGFRRTEFRAVNRPYFHPQPASCVAICRESCANGIYCIDDWRVPKMQVQRKYVLPRKAAARPFPAMPQ